MGMGYDTAKLFAEAGARVALADYNTDLGAKAAGDLADAGHEVIFIETDVSASDQVEALVTQTVEAFGRLDVAVNNAAVRPDNAPIAEFDEDYWEKIMAVDLKGTALCLKYEIRQLLKQGGGGSIVNISSVSGFRPQPYNVAYVAAKHGVVGMTKVAALEYGAEGIRVNSVAPGAIDTPMLREALAETGQDPEAFAPQLSLLNRFGQGREIAHASLWLASDQASYITGTTLQADAGYTNR